MTVLQAACILTDPQSFECRYQLIEVFSNSGKDPMTLSSGFTCDLIAKSQWFAPIPTAADHHYQWLRRLTS
jgi:hypothetical protein